jgi:hypothetical protein
MRENVSKCTDGFRSFMLKKIWNKLTTSDKILILFLILLSIALIFAFPHHNKKGTVEVYRNNKLLAEYPLDKNQVIDIFDGCKAEIKDGKVRMLESTCRNKLCIRQGWSDQAPIICMPEKVSLVIRNSSVKQKIHILH